MDQKEKLVDYLYGEMNATEKSDFEAELQQNPALQKELADLQKSRFFLADLPDVQPPVTIVALKPSPKKWKKWLIPMGIAASLLMLLEVFNFQVITAENGLTFSFGIPANQKNNSTEIIDKYLTLAEVQHLLDKQKAAQQKDLLLMDSLWQNRLTEKEYLIQKNLNRQLIAYQSNQQEDLKTFAKTLRQEEIPELANLMQQLQTQQQQDLKIILNEFWQGWQKTRTEDLSNIQGEFANVYQNQTETDALLVNIITNGDD